MKYQFETLFSIWFHWQWVSPWIIALLNEARMLPWQSNCCTMMEIIRIETRQDIWSNTNLFNWMTTTVLLLFSLFILRIYLEMLLLLFIVELHSNEKYCESSECVFLYVAINFIKFSSFSLQKHNNWIVPMLEFHKQRYWTRRHSTMEPENAMQ